MYALTEAWRRARFSPILSTGSDRGYWRRRRVPTKSGWGPCGVRPLWLPVEAPLGDRQLPPLWLMISLLALPQVGETILVPALPNLARSLSVDVGQTQWVIGVFFFGFATGVWVWGRICDRWGRRAAVLAGLVTAAVGTLVCVVAPVFGWLLAGRVIQAFGLATCSVSSQTTLRDRLHGPQLVAYFSTLGMVLAWSPAIGALMGQLLSDWRGYRMFLAIVTGVLVVLCVVAARSWPETKPVELVHINTCALIKRMAGDTALYLAAIQVAGLNILVFSFYAAGPFLIGPLLGLGFGWVGLPVAAVGAAGAALNRHLPATMTSNTRVRLSLVIVSGAVMGQLIVACTVTNPRMWWAVPGLALFAGSGLAIPNLLGPALHGYSDSLGRAGAVFGLAYYLLIGAGLAATSALSFATPIPLAVFWLGVVACVVLANLIPQVYPARRRVARRAQSVNRRCHRYCCVEDF